MSSDGVAIRAEGITKSFRIAERDHARAHRLRRTSKRSFTAVNDVTMDVPRGQVTGLVGANGAGKSTLLKILSRVMHPDKGRIAINGPVMSLLEVGAGFHPELTARENVYLNGAILGLDARSVSRYFDDIVTLAGVAAFLEVPVKRFSSGMRVRLAIAVGLHLDCDAIILDEVLSVGDAEFQKRCLQVLDKMVREHGRAALLVSHNMNTIQQACQRVIVLDGGSVAFEGSPEQGVDRYFHKVATDRASHDVDLRSRTNPYGGEPSLKRLRLVDEAGTALVPVTEGSFGLELELDVSRVPQASVVTVRIGTRSSPFIASVERHLDEHVGECLLRWSAAQMPLTAGQYVLSVTLTAADGTPLDAANEVVEFTVTDPASTSQTLTTGLALGHVRLEGTWSDPLGIGIADRDAR